MMPIRVLELRSVFGTGGGPEKTILSGAALSDPREFEITVCYLRAVDDDRSDIERRGRNWICATSSCSNARRWIRRPGPSFRTW